LLNIDSANAISRTDSKIYGRTDKQTDEAKYKVPSAAINDYAVCLPDEEDDDDDDCTDD